MICKQWFKAEYHLIFALFCLFVVVVFWRGGGLKASTTSENIGLTLFQLFSLTAISRLMNIALKPMASFDTWQKLNLIFVFVNAESYTVV